MTNTDIVETTTDKEASLSISEIWKYLSSIALSCLIMVGANWASSNNSYITADEAEKLVNIKNTILENEMKHYREALTELKKVVENNNVVMLGVKEELIIMRQEIKSRNNRDDK
jgi:hypothetical protein